MTFRRFLALGTLIFAGEAIFGLPFHVPRYFRATVLEVFELTNAQLGDLFAVYGLTAAFAYYLGGPLADRFPARKLMALSLLATSAGGLYLSTIPGPMALAFLYGYWGVTTILLFWAALIRATRIWGGAYEQGRAFGLLDGGRGLAAAAVASAGVSVFGWSLRNPTGAADAAARLPALASVIDFYTAVTFAAGILCWFAIPDEEHARQSRKSSAVGSAREVLRIPGIWAQAMIVVCAYSGYKGLDNYALYAVQVLDMSELEAAHLTAAAAYIRPIAAVAAGFVADRFNARGVIGVLFAAMALSYGVLASLAPSPEFATILYANIFVSYFGVFGLRGVYFALLEETRIPNQHTGAAVGLISVVGFAPEIFFGPISGRILDHSPGVAGHMRYFLLLAGISALGLIAVSVLASLTRRAERAGAP